MVRMFSVIPENEMPMILMRQNEAMRTISMYRIEERSKNEMYCPIPAAMVETPNIDEMIYKIMRGIATRVPKTDSNRERKLFPEANRPETEASERRTQDAEMATIAHANRDHGPLSRAATPGTTKIPDPMVPPTPRLTSSINPSERL